ncbi:Riboflavin transporter RibZ [Tepidimonas alkaliphilus]|uniref:Riboflavin transporter RibZ n=1 Tax=Tepidimonas alkaliphilus TaxID=2588942 RepID=A0A554WBC1_9BURK|nr:MFS transporter [Tepidimonas alkaliphilus]TSE20869.1 Riboflavin transporter RibZ [Tepidimonas alkaliphilus]
MSSNPSADAGSPQALRARYGPRYRWWLLLSVMMGTVAALMSSTVINVAIPDLSRHFGLGQDAAQWVSSGFMAASVMAMLTTPWLLARWGFRRTYAVAMALLAAGGVFGGLADRYAWVLAARLAEGLAAGAVQPIPAIIIMRAFEPHEQGRASGVFGMGVVLAPALGPSLGGMLADHGGWRSLFFLVVPFAALSWALARRFVPTTAPGGMPARARLALDGLGLGLAGSATLALLLGLSALHAGPPKRAAALLGLAALLVVAFVAWQQRRARLGHPQPLLSLDVFAQRAFAAGSMVSLIYGAALFGSTYLFPVYLQLGLGWPASSVGALLLPAGLALALTIAAVGRLADRLPPYRLVATGLALLTLSFVAFALAPATAPLALLAAWAVLGRLGLGLVLPSLNLGAMRGLSAHQLPHGSSAIGVLRMLGGAIGVSLSGVFLQWRLAAHGVASTDPLPAAERAARLAAFADTFWLLAGICALALLSAWGLRTRPEPSSSGKRAVPLRHSN